MMSKRYILYYSSDAGNAIHYDDLLVLEFAGFPTCTVQMCCVTVCKIYINHEPNLYMVVIISGIYGNFVSGYTLISLQTVLLPHSTGLYAGVVQSSLKDRCRYKFRFGSPIMRVSVSSVLFSPLIINVHFVQQLPHLFL